MPFLSSLASAAWDELEWTCLLSLSVLVISTSLPECPNAMMANIYKLGSFGTSVVRRVAREEMKAITFTCIFEKTEWESFKDWVRFDNLKGNTANLERSLRLARGFSNQR